MEDACLFGRLNVVQDLLVSNNFLNLSAEARQIRLNKGLQITCLSSAGFRITSSSSNLHCFQVAKLLIDSGAKNFDECLNMLSEKKFSANDRPLVELLLSKYDAEKTFFTNFFKSECLLNACIISNNVMAEILIRNGAKSQGNCLYFACANENQRLVELLTGANSVSEFEYQNGFNANLCIISATKTTTLANLEIGVLLLKNTPEKIDCENTNFIISLLTFGADIEKFVLNEHVKTIKNAALQFSHAIRKREDVLPNVLLSLIDQYSLF